MAWAPKYSITDRLSLTMRRIGEVLGEVIGEVKSLGVNRRSLAALKLEARELSAYASTSIEGNPLPLTDVKRLLKKRSRHVRATEQEVLNYNQALQDLYKSVLAGKFSLSLQAVESIQGQIVAGLMENEADSGRIRRDPVVIRNPRKLDEIVFIPPDAKDVKGLTRDLLAYVDNNIDQVDPIILAGIFHRQCVIIHPFMDGNGRTTRLATTAILGKAGFDLFEIFSFENYYNQNITQYFNAVGLQGDYYELRDAIDFTHWLEYFAEGILDELMRTRKALPDKTPPPPKLEAHHRLVMDYIDKHGSITQREYKELSPRSPASRKLDFRKLQKLGLIKAKGRGRGTYYVKKS